MCIYIRKTEHLFFLLVYIQPQRERACFFEGMEGAPATTQTILS